MKQSAFLTCSFISFFSQYQILPRGTYYTTIANTTTGSPDDGQQIPTMSTTINFRLDGLEGICTEVMLVWGTAMATVTGNTTSNRSQLSYPMVMVMVRPQWPGREITIISHPLRQVSSATAIIQEAVQEIDKWHLSPDMVNWLLFSSVSLFSLSYSIPCVVSHLINVSARRHISTWHNKFCEMTSWAKFGLWLMFWQMEQCCFILLTISFHQSSLLDALSAGLNAE